MFAEDLEKKVIFNNCLGATTNLIRNEANTEPRRHLLQRTKTLSQWVQWVPFRRREVFHWRKWIRNVLTTVTSSFFGRTQLEQHHMVEHRIDGFFTRRAIFSSINTPMVRSRSTYLDQLLVKKFSWHPQRRSNASFRFDVIMRIDVICGAGSVCNLCKNRDWSRVRQPVHFWWDICGPRWSALVRNE
jgi:hypothetical protein